MVGSPFLVAISSRRRSTSTAAVSAWRTTAAETPTAAATSRAIAPHRGGRRFEGLVAGQIEHARTKRSALSSRASWLSSRT